MIKHHKPSHRQGLRTEVGDPERSIDEVPVYRVHTSFDSVEASASELTVDRSAGEKGTPITAI